MSAAPRNGSGSNALLERLPRQLSGGQRQRVAMGRAIVRDPKVFLFDEPLSNLDAKLRVHMRTEIKALHQQLKTTSIYVTHDQIEAMTMADRIVVMHDGMVQQVGAPLDLYDRPANIFVAGFIGSPAMNFLPAAYRQAGRDAILPDGQGVRLPEGLPVAGRRRAPDRPQTGKHQACRPGGLRAEVEVVEPLGLSTQFYALRPAICVFCHGPDRCQGRRPDTPRRRSEGAAPVRSGKRPVVAAASQLVAIAANFRISGGNFTSFGPICHAPRSVPRLIEALPATVPFVGPETQERDRGKPFRARIGANESSFGPAPARHRRHGRGRRARCGNIAIPTITT